MAACSAGRVGFAGRVASVRGLCLGSWHDGYRAKLVEMLSESLRIPTAY
jgi:hypothetical protein